MAYEYRYWGEFEDDDVTKLPQRYEAKVTGDNRVYFIKYMGQVAPLLYV